MATLRLRKSQRIELLRGGVDVATLGPGDLFGELALFDRGERTATVVAGAEILLLVLSRREFSSLRHSISSVGPKIVAQLSARLRQAYERADADPVLNELSRPWSL